MIPPQAPDAALLTGAAAGVRGRILPHDTEAEQAVIGALLLDQEAISAIRDILEPSDFYTERHGIIYAAAIELDQRGEPIDTLTLRSQLERQNLLGRAGGIDYIAEMSLVVPSSVSVKHYAQIVVDHAVRRRLISTGADVSELGFDSGMTAEDAIDQAEQRIFAISDARRNDEASHIAPVAIETYKLIEERLASKKLVHGVPTNYQALDGATQGLQPGELIILAARPSVGKTSFALNIARNASVVAQRPVAVFSLEMTKQSLVQRLICGEAGVDSFLLSTGQVDDAAIRRISLAVGKLSEAPLWIDDTPALSISAMRARARRMKAQYGIDLIVVDYLQLMRGGRQESRVQEVSDISSGLKSIAKELAVPVLALSQLSRESERRDNKRPQLSDLRDSGCLTGDSRVFVVGEGHVAIRSLVGRTDFTVMALNTETWEMEPRTAIRAFPSGVKDVFRVTLQSGRTVRASANHPFLAFEGWKRVDQLAVGDAVAVPRMLPTTANRSMTLDELALLGHLIGDGCTLPRHAIQYTTADEPLARNVADLARRVFGDTIRPRVVQERTWFQVCLSATERLGRGRRNPVASWLERLGAFGHRSHEKRVPDEVFIQDAEGIAHFLKRLWATDGCVHFKPGAAIPRIYYASSSGQLARDVQTLLLHLGIFSRVRPVSQGTRGRDQYHVIISGAADVLAFSRSVGSARPGAAEQLAAMATAVSARTANTNRDVLPVTAWRSLVVPAMAAAGVSQRQLHATLGTAHNGNALYETGIGRGRAWRIAMATRSEKLARIADSDVYWDRVASITPEGAEETFDITVEGLHNFVAENIVLHNSIEQDADVVMFIYREGMHKDDVDKAVTELIVAKNRNGPTTKIDLHFVAGQTTFREVEHHRGGGGGFE